MTFDAFINAMLLLIFAAFLVERSLAVIFESEIYIKRYGGRKHMKPIVAVVYSTAFVAIVGVNLITLITSDPSAATAATPATAETANIGFEWAGASSLTIARNVLIILLTGIFVAGGSKASLKLFHDVMKIKSAAEERRSQSAVTVPANPATSGVEAANGDNSARQISYDLLDNFKTLTS